jgi:hypothetical protein
VGRKMKNWISILFLSLVLLGCSSTSSSSKITDKAVALLSTETSFIINGKTVDRTDGEGLLKELAKTNYTQFVVIGKDVADIQQFGEKLKAAGYSFSYIDSDRRLKPINL